MLSSGINIMKKVLKWFWHLVMFENHLNTLKHCHSKYGPKTVLICERYLSTFLFSSADIIFHSKIAVLFKIDFKEKKGRREIGRGTELTTWVYALTRNWAPQLLVYERMFQPTEPPGQGNSNISLMKEAVHWFTFWHKLLSLCRLVTNNFRPNTHSWTTIWVALPWRQLVRVRGKGSCIHFQKFVNCQSPALMQIHCSVEPACHFPKQTCRMLKRF